MKKFALLKSSLAKDNDESKIYTTETPEYRIGIALVLAMFFSYYTLDHLNLNIPEWGDFLMAAGMVFGYGFAFTSLFLSRHAGKVNISHQRISIQPKKNPEKYPDSPIYIDENSEIRIYLMKSIKFGYHRTLLHMQVANDGDESNFGMLLKNKEKHEQYFELLEGWYRAGYDVHEFDQLGSRIFKLNEGTNYADVQRIKKEYGIEWQ
ncbi:hypothetical protein [Gracilimonas sp.]|uniref:hypothetical protein n=1 Tax=Gracilimonas sp. TaxID=1974203 RepID=UPI002872168A|nr:hypothetical protein [Gracilimonas sp.]